MLSNSTVCLEFKDIKGKLCVVIVLRETTTNEAIMEYAPIEDIQDGVTINTGILVSPNSAHLQM